LKALDPLFYPRSVAILGASADPARFGNIILSAIMEIGYEGRIYQVNPEAGKINGLKAYLSSKEIPGEVDFAILTIRAPFLISALEVWARMGVKEVEILTSGFKETGTSEGRRMEDEIARFTRRGMQNLGPNCFGIYCPESGLTILPGQNFSRETGPVGSLSQSDGLCADLGPIAKGLGVRFSKMVRYGNGYDVAVCGLLEYFFADPKTRIIGGYIEGVDDGPRSASFPPLNRRKSSAWV